MAAAYPDADGSSYARCVGGRCVGLARLETANALHGSCRVAARRQRRPAPLDTGDRHRAALAPQYIAGTAGDRAGKMVRTALSIESIDRCDPCYFLDRISAGCADGFLSGSGRGFDNARFWTSISAGYDDRKQHDGFAGRTRDRVQAHQCLRAHRRHSRFAGLHGRCRIADAGHLDRAARRAGKDISSYRADAGGAGDYRRQVGRTKFGSYAALMRLLATAAPRRAAHLGHKTPTRNATLSWRTPKVDSHVEYWSNAAVPARARSSVLTLTSATEPRSTSRWARSKAGRISSGRSTYSP